ncbi:phytanoyl-CoA dioxygenase family protein [uncultured Shewanella sp.]|uniref:phytanoyl-CoA dioxygenase family protein n=1 Tax=uncultured Shewanella sp. TaxID=173975 RepID=UPI002623CE7A|nr:phytanoyl-CoA dioxygenase family protein [uncultured Shewanella sp.]
MKQEREMTAAEIDTYQRDGVVLLKGVFTEWIPSLIEGANQNVAFPSARALTHQSDAHSGFFFEDFCNWQQIEAYRRFVLTSSLGRVAAQLMKSTTAQFFHDHLLHKEACSTVATPWHQDMPYYCVDGQQTVSFWIPLSKREKSISLKSVAKSHLLTKEIRPTSWSTAESFYADDSHFMDLPDIENSEWDIKVWGLELGDAVAFNFKTIHGANANTLSQLNQTLSFRVVGDDARFIQRPGRTSPNYPDLNQKSGERLREDWFPVIYPKKA